MTHDERSVAVKLIKQSLHALSPAAGTGTCEFVIPAATTAGASLMAGPTPA